MVIGYSRMVVLALAASLPAACVERRSEQSHDQRSGDEPSDGEKAEGETPSGKGASPAPAEPKDAIRCRQHSDCPRLACGPCNPGQLVAKRRNVISCYVNPCLGNEPFCNADGLCAVHPNARKNPKVFGGDASP